MQVYYSLENNVAVRKMGRNKDFCKRYKIECRAEKNAGIKQVRHRLAHPNDSADQKTPVDYTRKKPLTAYEQYLIVKKV